MDWTDVTITVPQKDCDAAAAIAQMVVPYGLYIEDYSDLEEGAREIAHIDLIDEELLKKDRTHAVIHVYLEPQDNPDEALAFLSERLNAAGIPFATDTAACRTEDWINNWRKYFHPIEVGKKLLISPPGKTPPTRTGARCCIWSRVSRSARARTRRHGSAWRCSRTS